MKPLNRQLFVSWNEPVDNGETITNYILQYRESDASETESSWRSVDIRAPMPTKHTIGSLDNDTSYDVRVNATNSIATSDWSEVKSATPKEGPPEKPTDFVVIPGDGEVTLTWSDPDNSDIDKWEYYQQSDGDRTETWEVMTDAGATTTSYTIDSLTNGTAYTFKIRAHTTGGYGPKSDAVTMYAGAPEIPEIEAVDPGPAFLSVTWSAPEDNGADITGYEVQYKLSTDSSWTDLSPSPGTDLSTEIALTDGVGNTYDIQVSATNSRGSGPWSNTASGTVGVPSAPSVTLTPGSMQLTATWSASADNGDSITGYTLQYRAT